jgi:uncharacterized membrane protein
MIDKRTTAVAALGLGALGVAVASRQRKPKDVTAERAHSSRSVTVRVDAQRLYAFWRSGDTLPEVFRGERHVEIVAEEPGKLLSWRNVRQVPFKGGGSLTFADAPGSRGTEMRLSLYIDGPGSHAAGAFRRLFGRSPAQVALETLRRFKALAEAGEIPRAVRS